MAVTIVGTVGTGENSSATSLDHNQTIPSGSSNVLQAVGTSHKDVTGTLSSVVWDPASANETLNEEVEGVDAKVRAALSTQVNPANQGSGAKTVRHTCSATMDGIVGGGMTFAGVDQTTPISNATSEGASSGDPNVTVTTNADSDDFVLDTFCKSRGRSWTVDGSQVERWQVNVAAGDNDGGGSTEAGGTNPTEMDWAGTGGNDNSVLACGMLINAAAVAGTNPHGPLGHPFLGPFGGPI